MCGVLSYIFPLFRNHSEKTSLVFERCALYDAGMHALSRLSIDTLKVLKCTFIGFDETRLMASVTSMRDLSVLHIEFKMFMGDVQLLSTLTNLRSLRELKFLNCSPMDLATFLSKSPVESLHLTESKVDSLYAVDSHYAGTSNIHELILDTLSIDQYFVGSFLRQSFPRLQSIHFHALAFVSGAIQELMGPEDTTFRLVPSCSPSTDTFEIRIASNNTLVQLGPLFNTTMTDLSTLRRSKLFSAFQNLTHVSVVLLEVCEGFLRELSNLLPNLLVLKLDHGDTHFKDGDGIVDAVRGMRRLHSLHIHLSDTIPGSIIPALILAAQTDRSMFNLVFSGVIHVGLVLGLRVVSLQWEQVTSSRIIGDCSRITLDVSKCQCDEEEDEEDNDDVEN